MSARGGQNDTLGARLRVARKAKKLSMDALAQKLETTRKQVTRWEGDENVPTKPQHRSGLIRELDLPADFFVAIDLALSRARSNARLLELQDELAEAGSRDSAWRASVEERFDEATTRHEELVARLDAIDEQLRQIAVSAGANVGP